jgi:hypothetical protein
LSWAHHRIGMYLAGILGLCALLHVSASARVRGGRLSFENPPVIYQEPSQEPPKSDVPAQQPQPDDRPATPPRDQSQTPSTGNQTQAAPASTQPAPKRKAGSSRKKSRKKPAASAEGEPQKRVIHRGSTVEPTTQLAQGITEEQAAKQRETTNQLLANTDASLQKLSGRQLTKDEQDTVAQIRRFMLQVKAADAAGDLQRAYKLAVKARLLADALVKP